MNDAPIANNDSATTAEDTPVTLNITANDTDIDGTIVANTVDLDPTTSGIQTTLNTAQGSWAVTNGNLTFTPAANYNGPASITYTVNDNDGATTNVATVSITVTPVNDAPVANNDTATTAEDTPVSVNIVTNDTDIDGTINAASVDLDPTTAGQQTTLTIAQGTWSVASGVLTFTPVANYNGPASITYTVNDNSGATSNVATVSITVTPVNDAPIANNDLATTNEDSPVVINVLGNDTDIEGLNIGSVTITVQPANGTVSVNPTTGAITFTPAANFFGTTTFTYQVCDNGTPVLCDDAVVTVTVNAVNDAPIANNDSATTTEDSPININVLQNDTDLEGLNPSSVTITVQPANGTVTVNPITGVLTFNPAPNFFGTTTFTYQVCDNGFPVLCDDATVTITVTPVNDAPIANNDNATTNEDTPINVLVLTNDTDIDGTLVNSTIDLNPSLPGIQSTITNGMGTWTVVGAQVQYVPAANFNGTAFQAYVVNDNDGLTSNIAMITITVNAVNDAPVVDNDVANCAYNTPVTGDLIDAGDFDIDGTTLLANTNPVSGPSNGTIVINPDGTYTYIPNNNFIGTDVVVVAICDQGLPLPGICINDTLVITVNPCTAFPSANVVMDGNSVLCPGETLTLAAAPGNTYAWTTGASTSEITVSTAGTYGVTVTSSNGCSANSGNIIISSGQSTSSTLDVTALDAYTLNGIEYTTPGTYTQVIQNVAGCDSTITLNLTLTVGIDDLNAVVYEVYPNPTADQFTIEASQAVNGAFSIQDAQGKIVKEGLMTGVSTTVDINEVARGIYFLRIAESSKAIRIIKN